MKRGSRTASLLPKPERDLTIDAPSIFFPRAPFPTRGDFVRQIITATIVAACLTAAACDRETRAVRAPTTANGVSGPVSPTSLRAGGGLALPPVDPRAPLYDGNAYQISEGQRYYEWFNCSGCHAHGGGDVGPALMDDEWRYGGAITQIRASIAEGRPNGMPSFSDKIPDEQLWQIAAYVRSMGGEADKLAASSRDDHMRATPPNNQAKPGPEHGDATAARLGAAR
jgi:cytochrome c oxidase cbb3-type subunit 3